MYVKLNGMSVTSPLPTTLDYAFIAKYIMSCWLLGGSMYIHDSEVHNGGNDQSLPRRSPV